MISKPCSTDFRLDGKVAVVTGGASGIGLAVAELFSQKGAAVCVCDIRGEEARRVAERIENAKGYQVDISKSGSVDALAQEIQKDWGKVDVLVNSAGVGDIEWARDMSEQTWRKVIDINLTGTFFKK